MNGRHTINRATITYKSMYWYTDKTRKMNINIRMGPSHSAAYDPKVVSGNENSITIPNIISAWLKMNVNWLIHLR
jgi:hypothetical protein